MNLGRDTFMGKILRLVGRLLNLCSMVATAPMYVVSSVGTIIVPIVPILIVISILFDIRILTSRYALAPLGVMIGSFLCYLACGVIKDIYNNYFHFQKARNIIDAAFDVPELSITTTILLAIASTISLIACVIVYTDGIID